MNFFMNLLPFAVFFMFFLLSIKILLSKSFLSIMLTMEMMALFLFMSLSMNFDYFLLNQQVIMLIILVSESVLGVCLIISIGRSSGSLKIKLAKKFL